MKCISQTRERLKLVSWTSFLSLKSAPAEWLLGSNALNFNDFGHENLIDVLSDYKSTKFSPSSSSMARILTLPLELLDQIANEVELASVVDFALSCKRLHSGADRALRRHTHLREKYFYIGNYTAPDLSRAKIPLFLDQIWDDADMVRNVKSLSLKSWCFRTPDELLNKMSRIPVLAGKRFSNLIASLRVSTWFSNEIVVAALILSLPNLQDLVLYFDCDGGQKYLAYIVEAATQETASTRGLSKLQTVAIRQEQEDPDDDRYPISQIYTNAFMSLESLKCIELVLPVCILEVVNKPLLRTSNVTEITVNGRIREGHHSWLDNLLCLPRDLRKLTFEHSSPIIHQVVVQNAQSTLEELYFLTPSSMTEGCSAFTRLRCISLDGSPMPRNDNAKLKKWLKLFPPSLQRLRLDLHSTFNAAKFTKHVKVVKKRLPNLVQIDLDVQSGFDDVKVDYLKDQVDRFSSKYQKHNMILKVNDFRDEAEA